MDTNDKWITIKSKSDEDNPRSKGYRRIKLGKGGKIVGGDVPKEVKGKKIGGKEFYEFLKATGMIIEHFKQLPAYKHLFSKHYIKLKEIMENKRKIKARLKKLMKSRISFGSNNNKPKPLFDLENELKNL